MQQYSSTAAETCISSPKTNNPFLFVGILATVSFWPGGMPATLIWTKRTSPSTRNMCQATSGNRRSSNAKLMVEKRMVPPTLSRLCKTFMVRTQNLSFLSRHSLVLPQQKSNKLKVQLQKCFVPLQLSSETKFLLCTMQQRYAVPSCVNS